MAALRDLRRLRGRDGAARCAQRAGQAGAGHQPLRRAGRTAPPGCVLRPGARPFRRRLRPHLPRVLHRQLRAHQPDALDPGLPRRVPPAAGLRHHALPAGDVCPAEGRGVLHLRQRGRPAQLRLRGPRPAGAGACGGRGRAHALGLPAHPVRAVRRAVHPRDGGLGARPRRAEPGPGLRHAGRPPGDARLFRYPGDRAALRRGRAQLPQAGGRGGHAVRAAGRHRGDARLAGPGVHDHAAQVARRARPALRVGHQPGYLPRLPVPSPGLPVSGLPPVRLALHGDDELLDRHERPGSAADRGRARTQRLCRARPIPAPAQPDEHARGHLLPVVRLSERQLYRGGAGRGRAR
ncbi:MAG: hypothetical protein BWY52_03312 [Chloroflexi bacterium ADurb.Bin325]|nr:MAG: hypothetical protein BWY52_03312 [Chloroflexi bacterium ADurb.Bin325]